jgi:hypothetical protein
VGGFPYPGRSVAETQVSARPAGRKSRPLPEDFAAVAPTMTRCGLRKRYAASETVVKRWIRETGVTVLEGTRQDATPPPNDLAELAAEMTLSQLVRHYHSHHDTVYRWLSIKGLKALKYVPQRRQRKAAPTSRPIAVKRSYTAANYVPRDLSLDGQAADHLRRFCAVYRCTEKGAADQRGGFWRYGNAVLTPQEIVARAERHGFRPIGRLAA